eukprot:5028940-Prymnesium_polylepis.1
MSPLVPTQFVLSSLHAAMFVGGAIPSYAAVGWGRSSAHRPPHHKVLTLRENATRVIVFLSLGARGLCRNRWRTERKRHLSFVDRFIRTRLNRSRAIATTFQMNGLVFVAPNDYVFSSGIV